MVASNDAVVRSWVQHALGKRVKVLTHDRLRTYGDGLYSYGSHFELARPLRTKSGRLRAFLLNGDVWGSRDGTTGRHQRLVREYVERTGTPFIIVPHSAMQAADINLDTVRIVDVLPDRYVAERVTITAPLKHWVCDEGGWTDPYEWGARRSEIVRNDDGTFTYTRHQHRLGESLFTATVDYRYTERCTCEVGRTMRRTVHGLAVDDRYAFPNERPRCDADVGEWLRCDRHFRSPLTGTFVSGASGIVTRHSSRTAQFLSGFDHNEPRPMYFLSEMPNRRARTVAQAYEILKPAPVTHAEMMGRIVQRQGDIFAVPLPTLDKRALRKMGASFERMGQLLTTNHVATEVATLPDGRTLARGILWHRPSGREPDHVRCPLPKGVWHLTVKNTVPLSA